MEDSPETTAARLLVVLFVVLAALASTGDAGSSTALQKVTFDGRSLIINGKREIFFSGSIHYPRSTPEMWPDLIRKAKNGGLNMIETYVFWNAHEPVYGQYNFEGRNDLVKFIKLVHQHGLYMTLRLGPFVQGEWNHGGLPYWLREVPKIMFRSFNEPFMTNMERYVKWIVQKLKDEKLLLSQGGPIAVLQIENEYNNIARAMYGADKYIQWAGNLALGLDAEVPWVMCKQNDAPGSIINTCNGRNCGDTFTGPNARTKPWLWTENWTAQYRVFGDPPSQRSAEDLAYSVARFFSKKGTLVNYYMYHGGTNFGRTGAAFVMTRYYDEGPLDEYGLLKEPKYGHLRDLHAALKLSRKGLLWGNPTFHDFDGGFEARVYESKDNSTCVAFLTNVNVRENGTIKFRGVDYFLPRHSISILPDCKTVVYNTQQVNSQHNSRSFDVSKVTDHNNKWKMYQEEIPTITSAKIMEKGLLELYNMTKDTTDYLWYTTSFRLDAQDLPFRKDIRPVMEIAALGNGVLLFVNDAYLGNAHGLKKAPSFLFSKAVNLKAGKNTVTILVWTVGMPDSGSAMERKYTGLSSVVIKGLNAGTLDLSQSVWKYQVGTNGEKMGIFQASKLDAVNWVDAKSGTPVTWYQRFFDAPPGDDPVALDMTSMGKGSVYINGESIGRYWVSFFSPLGQSSQPYYHIPRSFMKGKDNLMVVFEEEGGKPEDIKIMMVKRDDICSIVSDLHPAKVRTWSRENNRIRSSNSDTKPEARLDCGNKKKVIDSIVFASYGNPDGPCGNFTTGSCHAADTESVVKKTCLGKTSCALPVSADAYGGDPNCPGTLRKLAVQVRCERKDKDGSE